MENGGVETEQVNDLEESIRYYVSDGINEDFMEDDEMYDELNLEDDEGVFGMGADGERGSSQDTNPYKTIPNRHPKPRRRPLEKQQKKTNPRPRVKALLKRSHPYRHLLLYIRRCQPSAMVRLLA